MAMTFETHRRFNAVYPIAALLLAAVAPSSARADFFDDTRRTFETDIPHFFQDDVPCAFGGQPTSHTKTSCKSPDQPTKHATDKDRGRAAAPSDKPHEAGDAPPSPGR